MNGYFNTVMIENIDGAPLFHNIVASLIFSNLYDILHSQFIRGLFY